MADLGLTLPTMKPNEILAAIVREIRKDVDPVPEGYLSREQLEKAWKMPKSTAQGYIYDGMKRGILHRIRLRSVGAGGKKVWAYYYKDGPAPSCRKPKPKV